MKRFLSVVMTIMLVASSVIVLTGCGGAEAAKQTEAAATEPGVEVMGISKYSRTELGMLMELKTAWSIRMHTAPTGLRQ